VKLNVERTSNPKYDHQRAINALRRAIRRLWRDKKLRALHVKLNVRGPSDPEHQQSLNSK
jgi:hypothetical protein